MKRIYFAPKTEVIRISVQQFLTTSLNSTIDTSETYQLDDPDEIY